MERSLFRSSSTSSASLSTRRKGTSLAVLLPPIGLLAALRYYRAGHGDLAVAGLLALGFFFGASIGAIVATKIEGHILRKVFGAFLFLVSLHMMLGRHGW